MVKGTYKYWRLVDEDGRTLGFKRTITPTDGRSKKIVQYSRHPESGYGEKEIEYFDAFFIRKITLPVQNTFQEQISLRERIIAGREKQRTR